MNTDSLVARVCPRRSPDFALVRERVRHWVREELFIMGAMYVGRGRSRDFSRRCVLEAALFNELADLGIPVAAWSLTDAKVEIIEAGERWAEGDRRQRWLQLVFQRPSSKRKKVLTFKDGRRHQTTLLPKITAYPHIDQLKIFRSPGTAAMVVIDITALLKRVKWSRADEEADRKMWSE
jgi:hypothetical protein